MSFLTAGCDEVGQFQIVTTYICLCITVKQRTSCLFSLFFQKENVYVADVVFKRRTTNAFRKCYSDIVGKNKHHHHIHLWFRTLQSVSILSRISASSQGGQHTSFSVTQMYKNQGFDLPTAENMSILCLLYSPGYSGMLLTPDSYQTELFLIS